MALEWDRSNSKRKPRDITMTTTLDIIMSLVVVMLVALFIFVWTAFR